MDRLNTGSLLSVRATEAGRPFDAATVLQEPFLHIVRITVGIYVFFWEGLGQRARRAAQGCAAPCRPEPLTGDRQSSPRVRPSADVTSFVAVHESAYGGCKGDICERLPNNRDI